MKSMKVVFLFGALPHYMLALLNLIAKVSNLEVVVILPSQKGKTVGVGVYESNQDALFKIIRLEEYTLRFLGKAYFKNLTQVIEFEKPHLIVLGWPYIIGFIFDWKLRRLVRSLNIKIIYRSIPYQIPLYKDAMRFYTQEGFYTEDMQHIKADNFFKKMKYWIFTKLAKYYFNMVDAHLNYTTLAYDILESYGVPREKIFVSYNSGDTDALFRAKDAIKHLPPILPPNPHRIIHIGRLIKWKKVDLLINVFADILQKYPQAELVIVGSGTEDNNLKEQVKKLNIERNVVFVGAVHEPNKLGQYLQASTIYVLAGAGGLSINDAMAFGKPVICSVADGTEKDLVIPYQTGFIFDNTNPKDLYEKIDYMFSNPEKCEEMGKNAEDIIQNKINIHVVASRFIDAFNFVTNHQFQLQYVH
jgi:glycosyltransferase involved in cell wall biosynthesis